MGIISHEGMPALKRGEWTNTMRIHNDEGQGKKIKKFPHIEVVLVGN